MNNVKNELIEIDTQLSGLGKYTEDNANILETVFEDRFKPVVELLNEIDPNTFHSFTITEIEPQISLAVRAKGSIGMKKKSYKEAKEYLLFAVERYINLIDRTATTI
jgi:hypothetical protein